MLNNLNPRPVGIWLPCHLNGVCPENGWGGSLPTLYSRDDHVREIHPSVWGPDEGGRQADR